MPILDKPAGCFRLVAWNCAGGLQNKLGRLAALQPDIAVVSEACQAARLPQGTSLGVSAMEWVGSIPFKGLAVLSFGEYIVRSLAVSTSPELEWVLPVQLLGPVDVVLLAVWAQTGPSKRRIPTERFDLPPGQLLDVYADVIDPARTIIAGDFNHHPRWDRGKPRWDFTTVIDAYRDLGLISAYHAWAGLEHGHPEEPATHWSQGNESKPYHLDYCFLPERWTEALRSVAIGDYATWGRLPPHNDRSDHAPIVVDLDLNTLKNLG